MRNLVFIFSLFLLLISCDSSHKNLEEQAAKVRSLSELVTAEYVISKILLVEDDAWYKIGDRKILYEVKASVKAGINFDKLKEEDIKADYKEKSIEIFLPRAEILVFKMEPQHISLKHERVSTLRSNFTHQEKLDIQKLGEKEIQAQLNEMDILRDSERNVVVFLEALLQQAGYETINIKFI